MLKDQLDLSIETAVIKLQEGQTLSLDHIYALVAEGVDVSALIVRFAQ
jgi:hypothetical protein